MKQFNRRTVVNLIRDESVSRADLARKTGLTRAGISNIIDDLIESEIIIESGVQNAANGRKPMHLKLNSEQLYCIGVSIRYGVCFAGIADIDGNIVVEESLDFSNLKDTDEGISLICNSIKRMVADHVTTQKILGVGITSPGPVDIYTGRILNPPKLPKWRNVPIVSRLNECFDYKIILEKDSVSSAISLKNYGCGKDHRNFFYVEVVRDGVGSVIVLNNDVYRGNSGFAGEFGHLSIELNGRPCSCGNSGCLERYASFNAITEDLREDYPEVKTWKEIVDGAESDDRLAQTVRNEARYLGTGIVSVINLLDLDAVIIGGDVVSDSRMLLDEISHYVNNHMLTRNSKQVPVYFSNQDYCYSFLSSVSIVSERFFQGGLSELL
jgi:predicted NBD/HSP70 family sugar kinase